MDFPQAFAYTFGAAGIAAAQIIWNSAVTAMTVQSLLPMMVPGVSMVGLIGAGLLLLDGQSTMIYYGLMVVGLTNGVMSFTCAALAGKWPLVMAPSVCFIVAGWVHANYRQAVERFKSALDYSGFS